MHFDLKTLTVVLGLIYITQFIAVFTQYRLNRSSRGLRAWLLGSGLMAFACVLMPLVGVPSLLFLARISNPVLVLGQIFLYIGIARFLGQDVSRRTLVIAFALFLGAYYYFMYPVPSMGGRIIAISVMMVLLPFLTAHVLLTKAKSHLFGSRAFTASIFIVHGVFFLIRIVSTLAVPPIQSYVNVSPINVAAFILPALTSTLWTFGFVLMVNQQLNTEIHEEKELLQRLFDTSPDAAVITRLSDGLIVEANRNFLERNGFEMAEVIGQSILSIGVWRDPAEREAFQRQLILHGTCENMEVAFRRRDGSVYTGLISANLINIEGTVHAVSVARDITELRRAEAENDALVARNNQLQKAESLGRMAGAIAHHLNNQLQVVMSNLDMVDLFPGSPEHPHWLAQTKQAAERAAGVSRSMLAYLGQAPGLQMPLDLSELSRAGAASLVASLPAAIAFQPHLPTAGPMVRGNEEQLREIIANLLVNAREALGDAPGTIRLALTTGPASSIANTHRYPLDWAPSEGEYACLEVADTGCGIPEADLEKLFDPFFSTKFTGRGMGLCVVLGNVHSHGGGMTVQSEPGKGSAFRVHLPVNRP